MKRSSAGALEESIHAILTPLASTGIGSYRTTSGREGARSNSRPTSAAPTTTGVNVGHFPRDISSTVYRAAGTCSKRKRPAASVVAPPYLPW